MLPVRYGAVQECSDGTGKREGETMTPEAQRIAIAEFCGWSRSNTRDYTIYGLVRRGSPVYGESTRVPAYTKRGAHCRAENLPNYLNDLNAMNEAEEKLHASFQQSEMFVHRIEQVVYKTKSSGIGIKFATINATAAQRAEALLRTIGKWQTEKEPTK
jgi:hypothetical protein